MATENINVWTDAEVKAQAQQIFESIGLDLTSAVNLFLKQTIKANDLPFVVEMSLARTAEKAAAKRVSRYGVWKGKYYLPQDFDVPLDDFKEYI